MWPEIEDLFTKNEVPIVSQWIDSLLGIGLNSTVPTILSIINAIAFFMAFAYITLQLLNAVFGLSTTGKITNNKGLYWGMMRSVLALLLIFPMPSGLSTIQVFIMLTAKSGSNLAETVWDRIVDNFYSDKSMEVYKYNTSIDFIPKLTEIQFCYHYVSLEKTEGFSMFPKMRGLQRFEGPVDYTIRERQMLPWSIENKCGSVDHKVDYSLSAEIKAKNVLDFFSRDYKNFEKQVFEFSKELTINSSPRWREFSLTDFNTRSGENAIAAKGKHFFDGGGIQASQKEPERSNLIKAEENLRLNINQLHVSLSERFSSYTKEYLNSQKNKTVMDGNSWIKAGSYYSKLGQITGHLSIMSEGGKPTYAAPSWSDIYPEPSQELLSSLNNYDQWISSFKLDTQNDINRGGGKGALLTQAGQLNENGKMRFNKTLEFDMSVDNSKWYEETLTEGIKAIIGDNLLKLEAKHHPLVALSALGSSFEKMAISIAMLMGGLGILQVKIPLITTIGLFMWVAGSLLSYVLPSIPYIFFGMGLLSWFVPFVQFLIAAPFWLIMNVRLDQHTPVIGTAWVNFIHIALKPVLLILSLSIGFLVFETGSSFLIETFPWTFNLTGTGAIAGAMGQFARALLMVAIHLGLTFFSFSIIMKFPDKILNTLSSGLGGKHD